MRCFALRFAFPALCLALPACNCGGHKTQHTNGIIAIDVPGASEVTEQDTALGFDNACLANPAVPPVVKSITVKNIGQNVLALRSVTLGGPSAASFHIPPDALSGQASPLPSSIDPLGSIAIPIAFAPTQAGNQSASLTLVTDDAVRPTLTVHLTGTGSSRGQSPGFSTSCELPYPDGGQESDSPCIFLGFPDTAVGSSSQLAVHVANTGCPALNITGVSFMSDDLAFRPDAGDAYALNGTAPASSAPIQIGGGKSQDLSFAFTPWANDFYPAIALVTTNAPNDGGPTDTPHSWPDGGAIQLASNQFLVMLSGNGVQASLSLSPPVCNFTDPNDTCHDTPARSTDPVTATFAIHNSGGQSVGVTSAAVDANPTVFTLGATPTAIPAYGSANLVVTYHPFNGFASAHLAVQTSAGTARAQLYGGSPPSLTVNPVNLSFGDETQGTYNPVRTLTIGNTGQGALTVTGFDIEDASDTRPCTVDGGYLFTAPTTLAFPFTVAPGGSQPIDFTHHPKPVGGFDACNLHIRSDDPAWPDPAGHSVTLMATTYVNCAPTAVESPSGSQSYALGQHGADQQDGGSYLFPISGAGSYDKGDPGHEASCPGGTGQGVARWEWILTRDPSGAAASAKTYLAPAGPGVVSTCKSSAPNIGCVDLLVTTASPMSPPASDSTVDLIIDPAAKGNALYTLELKVWDGSSPKIPSDNTDQLSLSIAP